jgi:hypothetical protein
MPEFTKWVNGGSFDGGRLSAEQQALRAWYGKLLKVTHQSAFVAGGFYGLNPANRDNPHFGRLGGEAASGHWLYGFLRHHAQSGQAFLVVANFHGSLTIQQARVRIPQDAIDMLGRASGGQWAFADRLDSDWTGTATGADLAGDGLALPDLAPCTALMLEIK